MTRHNLFSDAWTEYDEEDGTRHRVFWRPDDARMGATLYELAPEVPGTWMHMHFGAEEMFFVLSGRPVFRAQRGREHLAPGDFVFCPEGRAGLHAFSNPTEEPAQILAISAGSFPASSPTPNTDMHGWRLAIPTPTTRERRRPGHHRSLRDPDRVDRRTLIPVPSPCGLRRVRMVLEAVPNVSEGRETAVISAIGEAFARAAVLLDVHSDPDHHRSVFTLAGDDDALVESLLAGVAAAVELIDLREPYGRPSPYRRGRRRPARSTRGRRHGARRARRTHVGASESGRSSSSRSSSTARSARDGVRRSFAAAGWTSSTRRIESGELVPDEGPRLIDPRSGAVLVGARHVLVAYNLDLATDDVRVASAIAASRPRVDRGHARRAGDRVAPLGLEPSPGQHERDRPRACARCTRW